MNDLKRDLMAIKETASRHLADIAKKGELNSSAADMAQKLTDIIKNIYKIEMLEEGGYSEADGEWTAQGMYRGGRHSYHDGMNYKDEPSYRGRMSYDDGRGGMTADHSYNSYGAGRGNLAHKIEELMGQASSESERQMLQRFAEEARRV